MADRHVDGSAGALPAASASEVPPASVPFERMKAPAIWLVVLIFVGTVTLWLLGITDRFDPPYLILILNVAFVGIPSFFIAATCVRGFLRSGSWPVLLLGAGALSFTAAVLLSNWVLAVAGANDAVTIHNTGALLAAALHATGAFLVVLGVASHAWKGRRLSPVLVVYLGAGAVIVFSTAASLQGVVPPFFEEGVGGTRLRQTVVVAAALLFFSAALIYLYDYTRNKSQFLYWYALGLLLTSVGMAGVLMQTATGTPLNWMGRSAQLLGGLYLLVAALVILRQARVTKTAPADLLASFFWRDEANLKLLFDGIMDAIIVTDQRFVITDWNRAAEGTYGWKAEEVVGRPLDDVLHIAHRSERDRERARETLSKTGTWQGEVVHKRHDGSDIPVLATVSLLRDAEGQVVGVVGVSRDITERKCVEEQLRRSEEQTRDLIRYAPSGIYEVDVRTGRFRSINDAMCEILGYTRDELLTMTAFDLLDDPGKVLFADRIRRTQSGEQVDPSVEYRVIKKDGTAIYSVLNVKITNHDGRPDGALVIAHDVTERRRAAEELRLAAEMLERRVQERTADLQEANQRLTYQAHLLENINDMLTVSDGQNRLVLWNTVAEELTGWKAEEVLGRTAYEVLEGEWAGVDREEVFRQLAETGRFRGEIILRRKDGSRLHTEVTSVAVKDEAGNITAYVAVNRDITERKRAEEELRASGEHMQVLSHRLIEAAENERRVIARELHDQAAQLLASLTIGLVVLAKRYTGSEEASRHIAYLRQIGDDLSTCMHDLAVSLRPASLDRVGLAPALNQLTEMFQAHANMHITLVTTGLHERLGPDVETAVYRIVQESLTNTVRHAQATRAGVIVQRRDGRVSVIIEDDGRGFDVDNAWHSGRLGLNGMRERAEMLGGTFAIETSPGCGTTIYAELPCPVNVDTVDQNATPR